MKNKKYMAQLISAATITSMLAGCAAADNADIQVQAKDDDDDILIEAMEQVIPSHSSSAGKTETVYVLMNADGEQSSVIVSDQLKNKDGSAEVTDSTELKDIVNVKGYGDYTQNDDGTITWDAAGSDVFYQGSTDKELPLEVNISYELNGEAVSAEQIAGADGHVSIILDYKNNLSESVEVDGNSYDVYVPFMAVSGLMLPEDHFSNVEVENAKLIDDGNEQIVVGIAYPGLRDSLDWDGVIERTENEETKERLEDMNFPEQIRIEADATDFELGMTLTLAGCDVFSQLGAGEGIDLSEVQGKMDELSDGSKQLVDGSTALKDGTAALKDGTAELYDGTKQLFDGTQQLADGTGKLKDGAGALSDGSAKLYSGTAELKDGSAKLYDGAGTLSDGTSALYNGAASLCDGIKDYTAGVASVYDGAVKLSEGAKSAKDGADQLQAGFRDNAIVENANALADGASNLSDGISRLSEGMNTQLTESVQQMSSAVQLLDGAASWMNSLMSAIDQNGAVPAEYLAIPEALAANTESLKAICGYSAEDCRDALAAYNSAHYAVVSGASTDAAALAGAQSKLASIIGIMSGESAIYSQMTESMQQLGSGLSDGIGQLKNGADQLSGGNAALAGGLKSISDGISALDGGLASLSEGADSLQAGTKKLADNNDKLNSGASGVKEGAQKLNSGAAELKNGIKTLNEGAGSLYDGAGTLNNGVTDLLNGAVELDNGARSLDDGVGRLYSGAGKLNDGAATLDDGAKELMNGMVKFDEEGISKISQLLGDDAADTINRIKAIRRAGENYTSFTGAYDEGDDCDNSVRFIFKTGSVK